MSRPTIASLADVRPGDLIFTGITEPLAASILVKIGQLLLGERARLGRRSFDHVIVVTRAAVSVTAPRTPFGELLTGPDGELLTVPWGVQAMPRGAERVELTPAKHWTDRTAVVRLPEDYQGQAADAAAVAVAFVRERVRYSFASYVQLAAWRFGLKTTRLQRRIDRRQPPRRIELPGRGYPISIRLPTEAICSVLADQCWTLAGKKVVEGASPQAVTPGKLVLSLWRYPGSVWGGQGIQG